VPRVDVPISADLWRTRDDRAERGDTLRLGNIIASPRRNPRVGDPVILGFACDAGVVRNRGRVGAAAGPPGIRRALAGLAVHTLPVLHDAGDVACADGDLESAQQRYAAEVARLLSRGARVLGLGGGHEIAWGSFLGLRQHLDAREDPRPILVVNLDAHFDLRTSRPASSGTPFDQIGVYCAERGLTWHYACLGVSAANNTAALFARAQELNTFWIEDSDLQVYGDVYHWIEVLRKLLPQVAHVYLTIDLDVLPAHTMPGVSAPAAFGVPLDIVDRVIMEVINTGKLRVVDLAEYNPSYDIDQHGARVAARLAWRILQEWN